MPPWSQQARYISKGQAPQSRSFQPGEAAPPPQSFITFSIAVRVQPQRVEAKEITLAQASPSKYPGLLL